jgi:hypothetical protein
MLPTAMIETIAVSISYSSPFACVGFEAFPCDRARRSRTSQSSFSPSLRHLPNGLTTREIRGLTGMASYNASTKLSKLPAKGVVEKFTVAGDCRHRWRVKREARQAGDA